MMNQAKGPSSVVRMGIVGYGAIGRKHAAALLGPDTPELQLTALCIRSAEGQAAFRAEHPDHPEATLFSSAGDLFRSGLCDAVLLATPHREHPGEAEAAFSCGLHVLTEKPAGVTAGDARTMASAAARSGLVYGIMYNQRTDPVYRKIRDMISSGELGTIRRITWIVTHWYRSQAYHDSSPWHSTWSGEGGGVLINQSIHQLDLWQWLFGMPDRIHASVHLGKYHNIPVEDEVAALLDYDSGLSGQYITSTGETPGTNRLEIACSMGKLVAEGGLLRFWKTDVPEEEFTRTNRDPFGAPGCTEVSVPLPPAPACGGHAAILNDFASAILHGTPLLAPGQDGVRALTLANCMLFSGRTHSTISTKDFPDAMYRNYLEACAVDEKQQPPLR